MHRTTRGQQTSWRVRRTRGLGWTVAVTLAILAGPVGVASAKKFQVVVFGDSYGSGEGAPAVVGNYDGGSIMVWIEDGWLSHLEIYWWSDDAPTEFPGLDELTGHHLG